MAQNNEITGSIQYYSGLLTSFLSYWNEDMLPLNGDVDFWTAVINPKVSDEYFDFEQSGDGKFYVRSTLNNINTGVYFVIIRSENSMATQKLIVK